MKPLKEEPVGVIGRHTRSGVGPVTKPHLKSARDAPAAGRESSLFNAHRNSRQERPPQRMNAEAAKGCKERASTYERRSRKEMLALLTTHRVTQAVLVLVVCVCSIRLAGPTLCATMTGMADSSSAVQMRRWTRQEYDRMIEAGVLTPED